MIYVMFSCVLISITIAGAVILSPIFLGIAAGLLWILLILHLCPHSKFLLRCMTFVMPHSHLVQIMDLDGTTLYVIAHGDPQTVMYAYENWIYKNRKLLLLQNGIIDDDSGWFFWEPQDVELKTIMQLSYDCMNWNELSHSKYSKRYLYYKHKLKENTTR